MERRFTFNTKMPKELFEVHEYDFNSTYGLGDFICLSNGQMAQIHSKTTVLTQTDVVTMIDSWKATVDSFRLQANPSSIESVDDIKTLFGAEPT